MLSMQDFPVDFAAVTTLKWGEGEKKTKMSENGKKFEIDTVSQLFLHGIVVLIDINHEFLLGGGEERRGGWLQLKG